MAPKSGSASVATHPRHRKNPIQEDDSGMAVVRAFGTLVKRRGSLLKSGATTVAADGTLGDLRPATVTLDDSPPSTKSKREHLDEKASAYAAFCRSRC
jgi:hypothetical protein